MGARDQGFRHPTAELKRVSAPKPASADAHEGRRGNRLPGPTIKAASAPPSQAGAIAEWRATWPRMPPRHAAMALDLPAHETARAAGPGQLGRPRLLRWRQQRQWHRAYPADASARFRASKAGKRCRTKRSRGWRPWVGNRAERGLLQGYWMTSAPNAQDTARASCLQQGFQ